MIDADAVSAPTDIIHRFRSIGDIEDLPPALNAVTGELGFDWYSYVRLGSRISREGACIIATNLPDGRISHPAFLGLSWDDPVRLAASQTSTGFRWSELSGIVLHDKKQCRYLREAKSNGLSEGFSVPAHMPGESSVLISFIVRTGRRLPEANLPLAELAGAYAYDAMRRLTSNARSISRVRLTKRQAECILLVAQGKTDWEIARILGISSETVSEYVDAARLRYGVAKPTQVVVRALADGHFTLNDAV